MVITAAVALTLINLFWLSLILFGLPGTWFMLLTALALDWFQPGPPFFSNLVLVGVALLALAAEIAEFFLSAAGARGAGGSLRGSALAVVGGVVGAIVGTAIIPIPVIGTLAGACLGAFGGSIAGDVASGKTVDDSMEAGRGAAIGRFWGTVVKIAVGLLILVILTAAVLME